MPWQPRYVEPEAFDNYLRSASGAGRNHDPESVRALAIEAASRSVDNFTSRQFGKTDHAETRVFPTSIHRGRVVVECDDLFLAVQVQVDGVIVEGSKMFPRNAPQKSRPWELIELPVPGEECTIFGDFGWESIPKTIEQGTMIQAARFLKRQESPLGVAGSPELGSELRLLDKIDPDVAVMIRSFRRWWAVGG